LFHASFGEAKPRCRAKPMHLIALWCGLASLALAKPNRTAVRSAKQFGFAKSKQSMGLCPPLLLLRNAEKWCSASHRRAEQWASPCNVEKNKKNELNR
jgi:hypothetical protein